MNLLFLFEFKILPSSGGVERVTWILSEEFRKKGYNIFFLSYSLRETDSNDKQEIYPQFYLNPKNPAFISQFNQILSDYKIDVIINQNLTPVSLELLNSIQNKNIKIISVFHNKPFPLDLPGKKYKQLTHPITLKGKILKLIGVTLPSFYIKQREKASKKLFSDFINVSDKLFLLSETYKKRLLQKMPGLVELKLNFVNNPNTFKIPKEKELNKNKENIILFVGRLEDPQKNVKGFIDIWNLFYSSHPDWKAFILGDGPHKDIFENYARKKKSQNLSFLGNRKDIKSIYQRAKILVMTSLYEGWPMVLPEAMANGCVPVVYDTFDALYEIIDNNKAGLIVPPFDKKAMVENLKRLANDDKYRGKIMDNGIRHIGKFNSEVIASIWLQKISNLFNCH